MADLVAAIREALAAQARAAFDQRQAPGAGGAPNGPRPGRAGPAQARVLDRLLHPREYRRLGAARNLPPLPLVRSVGFNQALPIQDATPALLALLILPRSAAAADGWDADGLPAASCAVDGATGLRAMLAPDWTLVYQAARMQSADYVWIGANGWVVSIGPAVLATPPLCDDGAPGLFIQGRRQSFDLPPAIDADGTAVGLIATAFGLRLWVIGSDTSTVYARGVWPGQWMRVRQLSTGYATGVYGGGCPVMRPDGARVAAHQRLAAGDGLPERWQVVEADVGADSLGAWTPVYVAGWEVEPEIEHIELPDNRIRVLQQGARIDYICPRYVGGALCATAVAVRYACDVIPILRPPPAPPAGAGPWAEVPWPESVPEADRWQWDLITNIGPGRPGLGACGQWNDADVFVLVKWDDEEYDHQGETTLTLAVGDSTPAGVAWTAEHLIEGYTHDSEIAVPRRVVDAVAVCKEGGVAVFLSGDEEPVVGAYWHLVAAGIITETDEDAVSANVQWEYETHQPVVLIEGNRVAGQAVVRDGWHGLRRRHVRDGDIPLSAGYQPTETIYPNLPALHLGGRVTASVSMGSYGEPTWRRMYQDGTFRLPETVEQIGDYLASGLVIVPNAAPNDTGARVRVAQTPDEAITIVTASDRHEGVTRYWSGWDGEGSLSAVLDVPGGDEDWEATACLGMGVASAGEPVP